MERRQFPLLNLPDADPFTGTPGLCVVCGAGPDLASKGTTYKAPDGKTTIPIDANLCMECCLHVWRAAIAKHGEQAVIHHAILLLAEYDPTKVAVKQWWAEVQDGLMRGDT